MKVLITGGNGSIASALYTYLDRHGHQSTLVSRRLAESKESACSKHLTWRELTAAFMLGNRFDAIVNLAGAPMISYWSERRKAEILASRLESTTRIYTLVRCLPHDMRPQCIINASSTAIYSSSENPVDEWVRPNRDSSFFQAHVWQCVEERIRQLRVPGVRSVIVRAGIVIGADRFIRSLLVASRLNLNFILGNGEQKVSWIARTDLVRIFDYLLNHRSKAGIYNAVSPGCISAREFAECVSATMGRRCRLHAPEGLLKLLLGELSSNFLISADVHPQRLLDAAFRWKYSSFPDAVATAAHELGFDVSATASSKTLRASTYSG